ncbi:MAG: energy-coupling factor transporter transmembrane component T [Actinomycetota bacterium]
MGASPVGARAWLVWLGSALGVLFTLNHPLSDLAILVTAGLVSSTVSRPSPFRSFLKLGLAILAVRTLLVALTGHTGEHVLLTLPELRLPALLGGTTLGGAVTGEVLASSLVEGVRIVAVVGCYGAFLSVVETIQVVRLLPRFLFEAGLVVNIAMAFAPQMARTARDVREAQAMRGARGAAPIVVPVLATALDRSTSLAESMDARGYGRAVTPLRSEGLWRSATVASCLVFAIGAALWAMGYAPLISAGAALGGGAGLAVCLGRISSTVPRSRYRAGGWRRLDLTVAAISLAALAAVLGLAASGALGGAFEPYSSLRLAYPSPLGIVAAVALAVPAALAVPRGGAS